MEINDPMGKINDTNGLPTKIKNARKSKTMKYTQKFLIIPKFRINQIFRLPKNFLMSEFLH